MLKKTLKRKKGEYILTNWVEEYAKKTGIWQGRCWWYGLRDNIIF